MHRCLYLDLIVLKSSEVSRFKLSISTVSHVFLHTLFIQSPCHLALYCEHAATWSCSFLTLINYITLDTGPEQLLHASNLFSLCFYSVFWSKRMPQMPEWTLLHLSLSGELCSVSLSIIFVQCVLQSTLLSYLLSSLKKIY